MTEHRNTADLSSSTVPLAPAGTALGDVPDGTVSGNRNGVKDVLPIGLFMTDDHRYYFNGQGPYPSVTTMLDKVLMKWDLVNWKQREPLLAVYRDYQEFGSESRLNSMDEQGFLKWAISAADKKRDDAARIGSGVHYLANLLGASESHPKGFEVPDEWIPYVRAFQSFLGRYSASSIVSSEHAVLNTVDGYAGTYDLIMWIDGELWLIDIKTSKGIYPEYGLQLAGYRWCNAIILEGDPKPYPMPMVAKTGILHLRPDQYPTLGWQLYEYPTNEKDFLAFLSALNLYKWMEEGRFTKSKLEGHSEHLPLPSSGTMTVGG